MRKKVKVFPAEPSATTVECGLQRLVINEVRPLAAGVRWQFAIVIKI
jgi:hypothetical protein